MSYEINKKVNIHRYGFVTLLDVYGSDQVICDSARISYNDVSVEKRSNDRNLIRYCLSHRHTSIFEQCELRFHLKIPIFVMRQLVRHRTANLNEISARYSVLPDEYFLPTEIGIQSKTNKQGTGDLLDTADLQTFVSEHDQLQRLAYDTYQRWLDKGVSREMARICLPVAIFTECIWKIDLHNFMHFLGLRLDSHAQKEIRDYTKPMYELAKPCFPLTFEAFKDYRLDGKFLSGMAVKAMQDLICGKLDVKTDVPPYGMTKREWNEFKQQWLP